MNTIRLGLFQESRDRFAFALHAEQPPTRLYREFDARDLRAAVVARPDGSTIVQLTTVPAEVAQARDLFFETMSRNSQSEVAGGVMALETVTDSWNLMVLPDSEPSFHVALAFSFYPVRVSFVDNNLTHVAYEDAAEREGGAWHMLHPAVTAQAAAVVFPDAPTGADACALLASRPGVVDYLMGWGTTFSLGDIEYLAGGQTEPSIVAAAAKGIRGEDCSWMYCVKLSKRAIAGAGVLAVSYARAKTRHLAGLRSRPHRPGLSEERLEWREEEIERYGHHLAMLELCAEYGIGLWSCPASAYRDETLDEDDDEPSEPWSVAVIPER